MYCHNDGDIHLAKNGFIMPETTEKNLICLHPICKNCVDNAYSNEIQCTVENCGKKIIINELISIASHLNDTITVFQSQIYSDFKQDLENRLSNVKG